jgi:hypothetical protein
MANNTQSTKPAWVNTRNILIAIIVALVLLVVFLGGVAASNLDDDFGRRATVHSGMRFNHDSQRGGLRDILGKNQGVVTGVVTAVNGNIFTLAGDGTTTQVTLSSSTQYNGASSVKINDTVVAVGTKNGDTFQANRIAVNPLRSL